MGIKAHHAIRRFEPIHDINTAIIVVFEDNRLTTGATGLHHYGSINVSRLSLIRAVRVIGSSILLLSVLSALFLLCPFRFSLCCSDLFFLCFIFPEQQTEHLFIERRYGLLIVRNKACHRPFVRAGPGRSENCDGPGRAGPRLLKM